MDKEWFKNRLDQFRIERGLSKCKLNEESGFPAGMIYQWYNTSRMPSIYNIETMCKVFHITLSEFFAETPQAEELAIDREISGLLAQFTVEEKGVVRELLKDLLELKKTTHGQTDE